MTATKTRRMRMVIGAILGGFLVAANVWLLVQPVSGQTIVKNPSALGFQCPDHDRDDQHEIDIVRDSDGVVIQTLLGGDPPADPTSGEVVVTVNVQPVAFGRYRFVARAVAGSLRSENSVPSAVWERAPGRPTALVVR